MLEGIRIGSDKKGHFDYPSLSLDFDWKPQLKIAPIYLALTELCLKGYFPCVVSLSEMTLAPWKHHFTANQ